MPPLTAFGRKWEIGSDDLVYPGLRNLVVRLPWFVATGVIYWQNYDKLDCNGGENVKIFLLGTLGILNFMILGDLLLIYNSSLGGIMDTHRRRFVPLCIYIKLALYIVELVWNSLGTYAYARGIFKCKDAPDTSIVILGLVICNWLLLLFFLTFWIRQFDPFGRLNQVRPLNVDSEIFDHLREPPKLPRSSQWERRLRCVFCMVCKEGSAMGNVYLHASRGFAYMFQSSNLVQSDYVAGIVLQGIKTRMQRERITGDTYGHNGYTLKSSINFDPALNDIQVPPSEEWNSIPNIRHFLEYAFAIFTIPAALLLRKRKLVKSICSKTQCCNCLPGRKKYPVGVEKDNCCYAKTAAIRTLIREEDLIYASYDNTNFCCPFFVALDHSTQSIVVSIRGSFSSVDFLVDSSVTPTPIDVNGLPSEFKAHRGFLTVAKTIKGRLEKQELLRKLAKLYPEYKILVTGISLGAGVATILSMMLHLEFTSLKCLAFAVPGAAVNLEAAEYCNDFITSIIYGDDLVARLGIPAFNKALHQIQSTLLSAKTPKYLIQLQIGCSIFGLKKLSAKFKDEESDALVTESYNKLDDEQRKVSLDGSIHSEANLVICNTDEYECSPDELRQRALERFRHFPPGRILHVISTPAFAYQGKDFDRSAPKWEVRWAERSDFNEIIFSNRMILDHIPFRLMRALSYFSKISRSNRHPNIISR